MQSWHGGCRKPKDADAADYQEMEPLGSEHGAEGAVPQGRRCGQPLPEEDVPVAQEVVNIYIYIYVHDVAPALIIPEIGPLAWIP